MSNMSFSRLKQKPLILITSILALCGWIVAFGGACMLKVLNGAWWVMIYQLCITLGHWMVFLSGTVPQYRMAMMTFLASSIPLLTIQVDYVIQYTKSNIPKIPATAYVSGYIILLTVQYTWILVLGSDKSTFFGRMGHMEQAPLSHHHQQEHTTQGFEPEFYSEKLNNESRQSQLNSATLNRALYPLNSTTSVNTIAAIQKPSLGPIEYTEKVQALHAYNASAQDPNELSFEKGEILEIVDRKGNWWQARKSNGAIGIIPSNYFAQH
ncbi:unnamed protein product [Mucor fragilis]